MNPRMAIDCIACARILTAAWSIPVATQNRIMRSCAVSFVVAIAMGYSRRQLFANAAIAASRVARIHAQRVQKMKDVPVTAVTPAESAGRTNLPDETRRTEELRATGRTMRGDCQRVFYAYRGRST